MPRTSAEGREFAAALATRLNPYAPGGMTITADEHHVVVIVGQRNAGGSAAAAIIDDDDDRDDDDRDDDDRGDDERAEDAALAVLSGVQDCIIEELRDAWPSVPGESGLALPFVRADDRGRLRLGFADTLELAPIELRS